MDLNFAFSEQIQKDKFLDDIFFNIIVLRTQINQIKIKKLEKYNKNFGIQLKQHPHYASINEARQITAVDFLINTQQGIQKNQLNLKNTIARIKKKKFDKEKIEESSFIIISVKPTKNNVFLTYLDRHGKILIAVSRGFMLRNGELVTKINRMIKGIKSPIISKPNIKLNKFVLLNAFFRLLAFQSHGTLPKDPDLLDVEYLDEIIPVITMTEIRLNGNVIKSVPKQSYRKNFEGIKKRQIWKKIRLAKDLQERRQRDKIRAIANYDLYSTDYVEKQIQNSKNAQIDETLILHGMRITKIYLYFEKNDEFTLLRLLGIVKKTLDVINFNRQIARRVPLIVYLVRERIKKPHNGTRKAHKRRL